MMIGSRFFMSFVLTTNSACTLLNNAMSVLGSMMLLPGTLITGALSLRRGTAPLPVAMGTDRELPAMSRCQSIPLCLLSFGAAGRILSGSEKVVKGSYGV